MAPDARVEDFFTYPPTRLHLPTCLPSHHPPTHLPTHPPTHPPFDGHLLKYLIRDCLLPLCELPLAPALFPTGAGTPETAVQHVLRSFHQTLGAGRSGRERGGFLLVSLIRVVFQRELFELCQSFFIFLGPGARTGGVGAAAGGSGSGGAAVMQVADGRQDVVGVVENLVPAVQDFTR